MFPLSAFLGIGQTLLGAALNKGPRPQFQIPGAAQEGLATARTQAQATTRPGDAQNRQQIANTSNQSLQNVKRSAGSGQEVLAAAVGLNNNTNNALRQNSIQNDQFKYNAQNNLRTTLGNFAAYQQQKFMSDVMAPYQSRVDTKNALLGSGIQNTFAGLNSMQNNKFQSQYLNYLTGGGQQAPSLANAASASPLNLSGFGGGFGPWNMNQKY